MQCEGVKTWVRYSNPTFGDRCTRKASARVLSLPIAPGASRDDYTANLCDRCTAAEMPLARVLGVL